jgi:hypothetical protein
MGEGGRASELIYEDGAAATRLGDCCGVVSAGLRPRLKHNVALRAQCCICREKGSNGRKDLPQRLKPGTKASS